MRPAIVILHYGRRELTDRLYGRLSAGEPDMADDILVLDNHAPEPWPDAWIRTEENLYWAGALALAARTVAESGHTHLWFLNNDIAFISRPPCLKTALARLARLETIAGPVGIYSPAVEKSPYHPQMVADPRHQYRRVAVMDGISPLISLDCLRDVGFDMEGNPYGYGVDLYFSMSAHAKGWTLAVDHQVVVRHAYHSTARRVAGFLERAAAAQQRYLERRLGPGYEKRIAAAKQDFTDYETMRPPHKEARS